MIFFDSNDDNNSIKKKLLSYLVIANILHWPITILEMM
jgi:hypothetical protein